MSFAIAEFDTARSALICTVTVPVRTVSEANKHEHWRYRQKRALLQSDSVVYAMMAAPLAPPIYAMMAAPLAPPSGLWGRLPVHVHLTRLAARKLDSDNLAGSQKHVRDAVAKFLGVDDGDDAKVTWSYGQEKAKGYAVRLEFYRRVAA